MPKMPPQKVQSGTPDDKTAQVLERLVEINQDIFILEALRAGARGAAVREFLHVGQWRITNVSKLLKNGEEKG